MSVDLSHPDKFEARHNGPDEAEVAEMLEAIGCSTLDELVEKTIPASIRSGAPLNLPQPLSEPELLAYLKDLAGQNTVCKSYIGMGYYDTHVPGVIKRNIFENPGWYTQYTPYQAEIAQGRLEALLNFQTMVSDLTGMPVANASLLDEATAAAEAMTMLFNATRKDKLGNAFLVSEDVHPQTLDVLKTRAEPMGVKLVVEPDALHEIPKGDFFAVLLQYPNTEGAITPVDKLAAQARERGMRVAVAADLLSLALLTPPGEFGADVVVGSAQRFGVPMGYGGPHPAFFASKEEFKRSLPGRLVGVSLDATNRPAFRLALQTREQHIRREKATSNICTAQVLLAIMAGMYAAYHGPDQLREIALRTHKLTKILVGALRELGFHVSNKQYFDTIKIELVDNAGLKAQELGRLLKEKQINLREYEDYGFGIALDETTTLDDVNTLVEIFTHIADEPHKIVDLGKYAREFEWDWDEQYKRTSEFLTHPVFNDHRSETEMLRYIKRLETRDLSLTTSMIPLGSCTMKLNASAEMFPVTWEPFSRLHPFAPLEQAQGYQQMLRELEQYLCSITGFDAVSLQPNSGAQGEYTGLMVIREYHKRNGQGERKIALIPSSAHGTNPASAIMAGMKVVVVKCDEAGNVDVADLKEKAEAHADDLAALMITYPSTHGVFEEAVQEICQAIHDAGGLVYMDGANMNAQVGLTNPARIGADVCHLNLHKTFCIPHGGGGPGMGPIGVVEKLAPYLPGHSVVTEAGGPEAMSAVSAAPWGSPSIMLISYAYIRMMGARGLTKATKYAILNANYVRSRLQDHYSVLYTGKHGQSAHELIIDLRPFKLKAGVEVEDVAKRLMDYGFHAPTVSFPVAGTMMIEPTESESKAEIDRFCEAMISIRAEIQEIADGTADKKNNLLKNAPHTAAMATADEWDFPYSRAQAVYPAPWLRDHKYWTPVARVNNSYGDRNLVCTCPPMDAYEEQSEAAPKTAVAV